MSSVLTVPFAKPFTVADLEAMPDDGHRYELLDGVLVVSSSPSVPHQRAVGALHLRLHAARPEGFEVFVAPLDVVLAEDTLVVPDLIVTRTIAAGVLRLPEPPLLAVEVISPGSRGFDLVLKRERLERAGIPSYWVLDPLNPHLIGWDFRDGRYVEVADVRGDETFTATKPYRVTITPSALITR
jgi:Uma2 family endonuclease